MPKKAAERAIALGEDDPFDYALALEIGCSLAEVRAMPYADYIRWRAYIRYRNAMQAHANDVAAMRARRR